MTVKELENILLENKIIDIEIKAYTEEINKTHQLIKRLHITDKKTLTTCQEYIDIFKDGLKKAAEDKAKTLDIIKLITDEKERKILYLYFVCNKTIEYIAEMMFYSDTQIIRKKKIALQKLTDIINNQ